MPSRPTRICVCTASGISTTTKRRPLTCGGTLIEGGVEAFFAQPPKYFSAAANASSGVTSPAKAARQNGGSMANAESLKQQMEALQKSLGNQSATPEKLEELKQKLEQLQKQGNTIWQLLCVEAIFIGDDMSSIRGEN